MSDITSRITTIIVDKLGVDASAVRPEADFSNDLGADSLDKVEVIMDVETEFGISIPDEEAEKLQTVGEAIAYLEKHLQ
ncbi:MAG: acyl carrier protein [Amoebophilaceae bacterium]|jgi:acyl carrier protein|nr:acyl carrier protein [Amoebophilaceae bacterium]